MFTGCRSADELIGYVGDLEILKKSRKSHALLRRIAAFSNNLGHYFDVIGILVQSHPEYAALAWGAFRLVLQVLAIFCAIEYRYTHFA
jgi:hypothetical protein